MKIAFDLPEIEGFEYTGERRKPKKGDWFLNDLNGATNAVADFVGYQYLILKKKAPKYKTTTVDTGRERFKYVEIKALEDLIRLAQTNIEDMNNKQCKEWEEIKEILNDNYQNK